MSINSSFDWSVISSVIDELDFFNNFIFNYGSNLKKNNTRINFYFNYFGLILFNQKPLFVKMFVYCSYSIFSFILYKLSYEYSNIYQYNIYISYFIILFIVYLIYVLNFKYINQLMKTRRKHRVMEIQQ